MQMFCCIKTILTKKCTKIDLSEQKHVYIHYEAYNVLFVVCLVFQEKQKKYLLIRTIGNDNDNFYFECNNLESYTEVYEREEEFWTPCGGRPKKSWETIEVQYDAEDFENIV